jgi:hypothetical protein
LGSAVVSSVSTSFADDQSPCRVIGDKVNPRFTALWVADDGIWAADDLNHSLILYDRLSGKEKKRIQGLATGLDFPGVVQVDATFKLANGKQGLIWASMNDTTDRITAYAKQDVDSTDSSSVDLAPAAVIRFNTIRFDGQAIYRGTRVYGFHVDERNDEIALGFEKRDFLDADGHASLGSVVIVNRGGADFSQLGRVSAGSTAPIPGSPIHTAYGSTRAMTRSTSRTTATCRNVPRKCRPSRSMTGSPMGMRPPNAPFRGAARISACPSRCS